MPVTAERDLGPRVASAERVVVVGGIAGPPSRTRPWRSVRAGRALQPWAAGGLALREPLAPEELGGSFSTLASPQEATALAAVAVLSRADCGTADGDVLNVMPRPSAVDRWWTADDSTVRTAAVAAVSPLPGLTDRVTDTRVVRLEQAKPSVPIGHPRVGATYRSGVTPTDPVVLDDGYLGFPWADSAAFNGRWAADRLRDNTVPCRGGGRGTGER